MNYMSKYHRNHAAACLLVDKMFQATIVPEITKICKQGDQIDFDLLDAVLSEVKEIHERLMDRIDYNNEEADSEERKVNGD